MTLDVQLKAEPASMPDQIAYSRKLGPLTPFVGEWEGDAGVDSSYHNKDDWTTETTYFEKAWFKPIPVQENGQQCCGVCITG